MDVTDSYIRLIEDRCTQNRSLKSLYDFLSTQHGDQHANPRIFSVNFASGDSKPTCTHEDTSDLRKEISEHDPATPRRGRILIIEDVSREVMSTLGLELDIDPMFFVSHIHSPWRDTDTLSVKFGQLPSATKHQNFATFWYHRSLRFPEIGAADYKLLRKSNIPRKVVVFPGSDGERVGLAQHCCSMTVIPRSKDDWLGLILVDPPIGEEYVSLRRKNNVAIIKTPSFPLFGGKEASPSAGSSGVPAMGQSIASELLNCWNSKLPNMCRPQSEFNMGMLSYFPLRIITAEWTNYNALMSISLRQYDRPPATSKSSSEDLDRINSALRSISTWPRRVNSSAVSLNHIIGFIQRQAKGRTPSEADNWVDLLEDYEHLALELSQQGKQLEATVPLVTAYLQLAESRRAYSENESITLLTLLASVFAPLSFVASLFSMHEDVSPGGPRFWLYFIVAVPLLILVLLVVRPILMGYASRLPSFRNVALAAPRFLRTQWVASLKLPRSR